MHRGPLQGTTHRSRGPSQALAQGQARTAPRPEMEGGPRALGLQLRARLMGFARFPAEKGARQDLRVLATDYASFAFVYVCKEAAGERSLTVQLYGGCRGTEGGPAACRP
uniref:Uncharacterized protein n=1 Tax=Varanus komodoensis TaxID=61221 RepID=A0A8D2KRR3_VARKO